MKALEPFLQKHRERIVGLDILRCVAILAVVYSHGASLIPRNARDTYKQFNIVKIDGVSIFFVLSGFLIGGILLKTITRTDFTNKDLLNFWVRRWFRTIPNYLLVLVGLLSYSMLVIKSDRASFRYFFFLQNFSSPQSEFFPESWSLCVEEWFYLFFPALCFLLNSSLKKKSKAVLIAALLFLIFPLVIRICKFESGVPDFDTGIRKVMILRLDSLMYGVIAAYLAFKQPAFWLRYKKVFFLAGIVLVVLFYFNPLSWTTAYPPLLFNIESIITFCFLPVLSVYRTSRVRFMDATFIFISIISYSMYLLNLSVVQRTIMVIINNFLDRRHILIHKNYLLQTLMFWLLTIVCSYLLYRLYEHPLTNLRDKIKIKKTARRPEADLTEQVNPQLTLRQAKD